MTFAFLLHPRDKADVDRYRDRLSAEEAVRLAQTQQPFVCSRFEGAGPLEDVMGLLISVPLTTAQCLGLPRAFVRSKMLHAARLGVEQGAGLVGLGAMTAVVTRGGRWLTDHLDVPVTTGNAYTAAVVVQAVRDDLARLGRPAVLAVVGATGSVGRCCATLLAPHCETLLLLGRRRHALDEIAPTLNAAGSVRVATKMEAARDADVVVLATAAARPLLGPDHLKPGAIVHDLTEPSNLFPDLQAAYQAGTCVVRRTGLVRIPGLAQALDDTVPPDVFYACFAETVLMAADPSVRTTNVGAAPPALAQRLSMKAAHWGLEPVLA